MLYFWCLSDQCDMFNDILVDIGDLGGSSSHGVNSASSKKRKRRKHAKKTGPEELARNKSREETNKLLRSLADRSEENMSMKVAEISLHRSSIKDLHSELRESILFISQLGGDNEFIDEIRNGLEMIRGQIKSTQSNIIVAEQELSTLKAQKVNRSRLQLLLSSDSDNTDKSSIGSSTTVELLDDEADFIDDASTGGNSVDIDGVVDPDAGQNDVDQH